jgi:hypothetical protein
MRLGLSRERGRFGMRLFWGKPVGRQLVRLLPGARVGFYEQNGQLAHRPGGLVDHDAPSAEQRLPYIVGTVERAWLKDEELLLATFRLFEDHAPAERVRRGLLALERDGRLGFMGISLVVRGPEYRCPRVGNEDVVAIEAIESVDALDLVTHPLAEDACLWRSLPDGVDDVTSAVTGTADDGVSDLVTRTMGPIRR